MRVRIIVAFASWAAVVIVLSAIGMRPSPVLLAAVAAAAATLLWLVLDLSDIATPVDWRAAGESEGTGRGADQRVRLLQRQLADDRRLQGNSALHRVIGDIVDGELLATHGIDRRSDPRRAAALLGDDLSDLLVGSPAEVRLADPVVLAAVLARIESWR